MPTHIEFTRDIVYHFVEARGGGHNGSGIIIGLIILGMIVWGIGNGIAHLIARFKHWCDMLNPEKRAAYEAEQKIIADRQAAHRAEHERWQARLDRFKQRRGRTPNYSEYKRLQRDHRKAEGLPY